MGIEKPKARIKVFLINSRKFLKFKFSRVINQKTTITGTSKLAGILNKAPTANIIPERKIFLYVGFESRTVRPKIIGPIRNNSALTIFPSKRGIVVKIAKIITETYWANELSLKRFFTRCQKQIVVAIIQKARIALNQKRFPARAAVK